MNRRPSAQHWWGSTTGSLFALGLLALLMYIGAFALVSPSRGPMPSIGTYETSNQSTYGMER